MFSVPLPFQGGPKTLVIGFLQRLRGTGAALPVRFGQLIPSKVLKELHTMAEPPIFTLGGCGGALAWPEATQNSQGLLSVLPLPPGSAQLGFPGAGVAQNEA